jgi:hypothetical protein
VVADKDQTIITQTNRLKSNNTAESKLDISQLTRFVFQEIPQDWPLRDVLLAQKDEIDANTFLVCLPIYLQLNKSGKNR